MAGSLLAGMEWGQNSYNFYRAPSGPSCQESLHNLCTTASPDSVHSHHCRECLGSCADAGCRALRRCFQRVDSRVRPLQTFQSAGRGAGASGGRGASAMCMTHELPLSEQQQSTRPCGYLDKREIRRSDKRLPTPWGSDNRQRPKWTTWNNIASGRRRPSCARWLHSFCTPGPVWIYPQPCG